MRRLRVWIGFAALALVPLLASPAGARTVEVHLVVKTDLQRLHPNAPPDEPLEPTPTIADKAREVISAHPTFRQVTVRLEKSETAPNVRITCYRTHSSRHDPDALAEGEACWVLWHPADCILLTE